MIAKQLDSPLWKEMANIWEKFCQCLEVDVNDGKRALFSLHKWVMYEECLMKNVSGNTEVRKDTRVYEVVDNNGEWKLDQVQTCLPPSVIQKIQSMRPPNPLAGRDKVKWRLTTDGSLTTSSTCKWLKNENESQQREVWRKIWKFKVPERVKIFMWQVTHQRLPTKMITSKWRDGSTTCESCHRVPEDQLHALRDCEWTRRLWQKLVSRTRQAAFFGVNWETWLKRNIFQKKGNEDEGCWPELFTVTCWHLWRWRNMQVHEDGWERPWNAVVIIKQYLEAFNQKWGLKNV